MKPLVVDTSVWIEWLHGRRRELLDLSKGRHMYLASPVEMELYAGAHSTRDARLLESMLSPFSRHDRVLVPRKEDFRKAGQLLAEIGLQASKHANDALICVCARNIGAEVWSLNRKEFLPLSRPLRLTLGPDRG
jgi:predicted nucleic acid-binding protein